MGNILLVERRVLQYRLVLTCERGLVEIDVSHLPDLVIETARVPMRSGFGVVGRIDGGAFAVTAGTIEPWGLTNMSPAMLVGSPTESLLELPKTLRAMPLEGESRYGAPLLPARSAGRAASSTTPVSGHRPTRDRERGARSCPRALGSRRRRRADGGATRAGRALREPRRPAESSQRSASACPSMFQATCGSSSLGIAGDCGPEPCKRPSPHGSCSPICRSGFATPTSITSG